MLQIVAAKFVKRLAQIAAPVSTPTDPTAQTQTLNTLTPAQNTAYMNHVIRVDQQSNILLKSVMDGIKAGSTLPEARTAVENLRNLAVRYLSLVQQKSTDIIQFKRLFGNMMQFYDEISNDYVDPSFDPMKQIRISLLFIGTMGTINMFPNSAVQPPPA